MTLLLSVYIAVSLLMTAYGIFQAVTLFLYFRQRGNARPPLAENAPSRVSAAEDEREVPMVTVQLPVFNERYVIRRVIEAVANLQYPPDRLEIQVLDDSTDDSADIARAAVEHYRSRGVSIEFIHRDTRRGFKAGALAEGLARARGELIAIFDVDFIPEPDFLQRLILTHRVFDDPLIGFAQTRWTFINRNESWLTRAQSVMHDVTFGIEQSARNGNGLYFNFNGSGGIWRRTCIEDAGGWSADTLAEDLDLSYRAQLRGWRGVYFPREVSPNELPVTMTAFKRQQTRWARGSIQCSRKLIPRALASRASLLQKYSAVMHMANYSMHLWLVLFILLYPPVLFFVFHGMLRIPVWLGVLSPLCLSYPVALMVPQILETGKTGGMLPSVATAIFVGVGVSVSNAIAVLKGLFIPSSGVFERTPKERAAAETGAGAESSQFLVAGEYALKPSWTLWAEFGMAAYCLGAFVLLVPLMKFWVFPLLLYTFCYSLAGFAQIMPQRISGGAFPAPVEAET